MRTVTLRVAEVLRETDLALLLLLDDDDEHWVPKSVIEDADDITTGDTDLEVQVAEWFCEKEGLV